MFLKTRQHANGLSHVDKNSLAYKTIVTYGDDMFALLFLESLQNGCVLGPYNGNLLLEVSVRHFDCHLRHVLEIDSSSLGVYRDQG